MRYRMNGNLKKNFIWNMIGMTLNSFNSLFFMIIVTRLNNLKISGIFTLAFSVACLMFYFGTYSGRVFQVTDVNKEITDSDYVVHRIITCSIMMIVSFIYCVAMHYNQYKFAVVMLLCMLKAMEAFADVFYGILHKNDFLYKAGFSLTIKSIISIIVFLVIDLFTRNIIVTLLTVILVWVLILIFYDIPSANKVSKISLKLNNSHLTMLFKTGFFIFLINFFSVYIVNAPKYALDGRVADSLQAIFGIILMPATLVSLAIQYFIQPYLQNLTALYNDSNKKGFNQLIFKLLLLTIGLGIVCVIGAYLLGIPVLSIVYGVDLTLYKKDLIIIIIGAIFYSMSIVFSAGLTTVRYTFVQFITYLITSVMGLMLAGQLIQSFGVHGATYLYFILMLSQFILYVLFYIGLQNKLFDKRVG